jgi:hypothetical protein
MSPALQVLMASAEATARVHDEDLVLQPGAIAVSGYAEELDIDPAEAGASRRRLFQLHLGEDQFTHAIHILRRVLQSAQSYSLAALQKVNLIEWPEAGKRYRVKHFADDPARPEVDFFCTLA